jgi:hypothetical protein
MGGPSARPNAQHCQFTRGLHSNPAENLREMACDWRRLGRTPTRCIDRRGHPCLPNLPVALRSAALRLQRLAQRGSRRVNKSSRAHAPRVHTRTNEQHTLLITQPHMTAARELRPAEDGWVCRSDRRVGRAAQAGLSMGVMRGRGVHGLRWVWASIVGGLVWVLLSVCAGTRKARRVLRVREPHQRY